MMVSSASLRQAPRVRWLIRKIGVERVVVLVHLLQLPLQMLLGAFVGALRRDPRTVVLGSPLDRFADNSAYLFLHMSASCPDVKAVWISGSPAVVADLRGRGLAAERRWSLAGMRACLRAGTFVYSGYRSDINQLLAPGAIAVALWHGVGIKRIADGVRGAGRSADRSLTSRLAEAGREPPADYFLSSTAFVTHEIFSPALGTPPERCWELGYPRNDHVATRTAPPAALVIPELAERLVAADRVVGLFLTWRGDRVVDAVDTELLVRLAALCGRHGSVLVYKAHYNMQPTAVPAENCVLLPATADLNAYLTHCDVLVTDYSSVAADFLLMRGPAVFFMPDLDEYAEHPGFYFPAERLPGVLTRDREALLRAVDDALRGGPDRWSSADEEFVEMLWGDYSGQACAAVTDAIMVAASKGRQPIAGSSRQRAGSRTGR